MGSDSTNRLGVLPAVLAAFFLLLGCDSKKDPAPSGKGPGSPDGNKTSSTDPEKGKTDPPKEEKKPPDPEKEEKKPVPKKVEDLSKFPDSRFGPLKVGGALADAAVPSRDPGWKLVRRSGVVPQRRTAGIQ